MTTKNGHVLMAPEFEGAVWKKSSYSGSNEGQCVEVANVIRTHSGIAVRDSKDPEGSALLFTPDAFTGFIRCVNERRFNRS